MTKQASTVGLLALFLIFASCVGAPDPMRHQAEQQALALTKRLADDWFAGKPIPAAEDQRIVRDAIADIERRLAVDAATLGGVVAPAPAPVPPVTPDPATGGGQ